MSPKRVLCYAPYNRFPLHNLYEMTILQACKVRGAEIQYVACDGLYSECDVWPAGQRPVNACGVCQAQVSRFVVDVGMDYTWLGRYLTTEEGREAVRWAQSLEADNLLTASYGGWRVGEWVRGSVHTHFRANQLDTADPATERTLRAYVYSGLIACFALDRLLAENPPDVLVVFNGRRSSTQVALELARARNIRVVVHERGPRNATLHLIENASANSLGGVQRAWDAWGEVPLTSQELDDIARLMSEREHGRDTNWTPFTTPPQPSTEVLANLGLRGHSPIWVLFTSSDDETVNDPDFRSSFASQNDWIERTIEHARRNPRIDLIIRVHPNTGSRRSERVNRVQLEQMRCLGENLPPNVRMVDPDSDISSYSLMELCCVGLVWASTVGIELACKGKSVVVAAGNGIGGTSFVHTVDDVATYDQILDSLLDVPPGAVSADVRRLALRHAYGGFFRLPIDFPLVEMVSVYAGRLTYTSPDALLPGRDEALDRCVRIVLEDEPVCLPPTAEDRMRSTEAEDAFLERFGEHGLSVLAFADELISDSELLSAWAGVFGGRDDVTLLIHTDAEQTPSLVDAVTLAGLDRDDGPPLVAGEVDVDTMASVDAVFSRIVRRGPPASAPRYGPESLGELAATSVVRFS